MEKVFLLSFFQPDTGYIELLFLRVMGSQFNSCFNKGFEQILTVVDVNQVI